MVTQEGSNLLWLLRINRVEHIATISCQARRSHDLQALLRCQGQGVQVVCVFEKSRVNEGLVCRVAAAQAQAASAFGPHEGDMKRVAMPSVNFAGVIIDHAGTQSQLYVGVL